ncbi:GNAT family N-acetyltransferase [Chelativorans salis]|uniref:GNAT family N-acetyltransferase n=1 Tax=Chelativorans salis TaxID=2978478 RepID=A0ABT2LJB3_9HYPH|nr:GNAT family N-acetyltransferase [Chelativorans sp. EGI FJ00035]MCT7374680.1 GNAT family N-acetyltransferase [Chelativorans sp. EGI FJ00035]
MALILRLACVSDVEQLDAIEQSAFAHDRLSRRSLRGSIRRETAQMIVADRDGTLVGYCLVLFRKSSRIARLYSLAVAPSHAGSGLGRILLAAAEEAARRQGRLSLRLEVREDNLRAIGLYERSGYRRLGSKPGYYEDGVAAIKMEKCLEHATSEEIEAAL